MVNHEIIIAICYILKEKAKGYAKMDRELQMSTG